MKTVDVKVWALTRVGGLEQNPTTFTARAGSFANAATSVGGSSLVLVRDEHALRSFVVLPDVHGADKAALMLAQAVGAKAVAVPASELPELDVSGCVASMVVDASAPAARESLHGADPSEAARQMGNTLSPGEWLAVSLRQPTGGELRRHRGWLPARLGVASPTHHSLSPNAVVVKVRARSSSRANVRLLLGQAASAMPGFDLVTEVRTVASRNWFVAGLVGLVAVLTGLTGLGFGWPGVLPLVVGPGFVWGAAGLGCLFALWVVGVVKGWVPALGDKQRGLFRLWVFGGAGRLLVPRKRASTTRLESGEVVRDPGGYPLVSDGFLVGPQVFVGLVAPQAGGLSGGTTTMSRPTPGVLTSRVGPLVGAGVDDGAPVYLNAGDMLFGVAALGRPGSGKSQFVRSMWAWSLLDRLRPAGLPGFPGARNSLVFFENKGEEGLSVLCEWGRVLGEEPVVVEVADSSTVGIDLFAVPGHVGKRAAFFVDAMVYAFAEGSIQDRARAALIAVVAGGLAVTDVLAGAVPGLRVGGSALFYAHVLLGGEGDERARLLAGVLMGEAVRLEALGAGDQDLSVVRKLLVPYFDGKSESVRRGLFESSQNKVAQLLNLEGWWVRGRRRVSWDQVLEHHMSVAVNTGTTRSGLQVGDTESRLLSSLLMFGLRSAIERRCSGWNGQGRSVSVFADELALLAGSSAEVVSWLRTQGRSFGVRPVLATQFPEQLPGVLRTVLLSFSTLLTYTQDNRVVADEAAADAASDGSVWVGHDVINLAPHTAVLRTNFEQQRQPACTVRIKHFEADMFGFPVVQGYEPGGSGVGGVGW